MSDEQSNPVDDYHYILGSNGLFDWPAMVEHYKKESEIAKAALAEAHRDNKRLYIELDEEVSIVNRIWKQLDAPTYKELKGRSIYDLIDEIKAERDAALVRVAEMELQRDAAIRLARRGYRGWDVAGGPGECKHGIAACFACKYCDMDLIDAIQKEPTE